MMNSASFDELLDAVSRFVETRLLPSESIVDEADIIPVELIEEMKALGLFGLTIPVAYGGLDLTVEQECRLLFDIGKTSPAFHSAFGTNNGIGAAALVLAGSESQKAEYLPRLASGEIIGAFAMSEMTAGSDAAAIATLATPQAGGWLLNGTKRFVTNGPVADIVTVLARTDAHSAGSQGLSSFIVEAHSPGVEIGPRIKKMGLRGNPVSAITFKDCFVPASQLLGGLNEGYRLALTVLSRGRLRVAALCVGIAERLIFEGVRYAKERYQFGSAIAEFQLIQAKLADCETEAYAARAMVLTTARLAESGADVKREAACAKYFSSEMVGRVADRVLQIHGGPGYTQHFSIERFYRDVRLFRLYEGTSEIQQLIIARDMIKKPKPLFKAT
jgi:acyl-CoA dehydrogenase